MSFDQPTLLSLLPAFYRIRDAAVAEQAGLDEGPLAELLGILAEQIAVLEEDLEQLQDDAFIETCADWVVPYIGDLIGYRALHGVAPRVASARAEVAHTIAYRRRKGTALVLEQLARDVTGWNASAVEYFQRLITTQYMNHRRAWLHAAADLRQWRALDLIDTAFDAVPRTVDVRRIASGRGKHNIPNVGLFVWPLDAHALTGSPAARVDDRRWRFHPLDIDAPLVTHPQTEDDISQLATPLNVPFPVGRRALHENLEDFYASGPLRKSLRLYVGDSEPLPAIAPEHICACNLSDDGADWAHLPPVGMYAIDPVLGRIGLPPGLPAGTRVRVDCHHAFGAELGGGEYERAKDFADSPDLPILRVPQDHATIQAALNALGGEGIVEISDSGRYEENLSVDVAAGKQIELRAANGHRPLLVFNAAMNLRGGAEAGLSLNGLLISGHRLQVPAVAGNALRRLILRHCTLVPGWALAADSTPLSPGESSLRVEIDDLELRAERCILGGLRVVEGSEARLQDCILDATAAAKTAWAALDGDACGGSLSLEGCTSIGRIHALSFPLISNSILLAETDGVAPWTVAIHADRRQQGCVRYSHVPAQARTPRRFHCVPAQGETLALRFASLRYGSASYAQLGRNASEALRSGADDEGEMGAYHHVYGPQRETNLRIRLDEYLRVGLEAGIFHEI